VTRLGGGLLIVGGLLGVVLAAIAVAGGEVGLGGQSPADLLASVSAVVLGAGAGALSLGGSTMSWPRTTRVAFGLDAIGLLGAALSASANSGPDTSPLVLVLLGSILVIIVGLPLTALTLLRLSLQARLAGAILAVGCVGLVLHIATGTGLSTALFAGIPLAFAVIGAVALRSTRIVDG